MNLLESYSETTSLDTDLYSAELLATWTPLRGLSVRPRVGFWMRSDQGPALNGGSRDDEFVTGGFQLDWSVRKIAVNMHYYYNYRMIDTSRTDNHRLMLYLRRRF